MADACVRSFLPGLTPQTGKVRDIYAFDDRLLFIATDRISAFDWILPAGIPDKGRVLTQVSSFWFSRLDVASHLLSLDPNDAPLPAGTDIEPLVGRSMVVRKTEVIPIECVVRGYLAGSGKGRDGREAHNHQCEVFRAVEQQRHRRQHRRKKQQQNCPSAALLLFFVGFWWSST